MNEKTVHQAKVGSRILIVTAVLLLAFASLGGGGFAAAQENATDKNSSQSLSPAIDIKNNTTDRSHVVLDSVTLPENGYIVAYGENFSLRAPSNDSVIGRTQYVRSGQFSDVVVDFDEPVANNTTVTVLLHNETNGNQNFDFNSWNSPDRPYLNESGYPVLGQVRIINNSTAVETSSVSASKLAEQRNLPGNASGRIVITDNGSGGSYRFSTTGNVTAEDTVSNTSVSDTAAKGSVNGSNSSFTYSGAISTFNTSGNVSVRLNGKEVDPTVLGANYITLTKNGSQVQPGTVNYGFTASKAIVPDGNAEGNDTVTGRQITGSIGDNDSTDTIYYKDDMTQSRLVGDAKVIINGQVTSESTDSGSSSSTSSSSASNSGTGTADLGQLSGNGNGGSGGSSGQSPGTQQSGDGPDFRVSNITLSSNRIEVGQDFNVTVTITNTGSSQVNANLGLASEGEVVDTASAGLFAGGSRQITFDHTYDATGQYVLKIALLNSEQEVQAMSTVDQTVTVVPEGDLATPTVTANETTNTSGPGFTFPIGLGAVILATLGIGVWRQRS